MVINKWSWDRAGSLGKVLGSMSLLSCQSGHGQQEAGSLLEAALGTKEAFWLSNKYFTNNKHNGHLTVIKLYLPSLPVA